jgi:hypothetical protein
MEETLLPAQFAESKGEKYDVAADFPPELLGTNSVFSVAAINVLIAAIYASCGCQEDICTLLKVDSRLSVAQAVPPANATIWSRSTATLDPIQIAGRYLERVTKISRIAGIRLALAFSTVLTERY